MLWICIICQFQIAAVTVKWRYPGVGSYQWPETENIWAGAHTSCSGGDSEKLEGITTRVWEAV